MERRSLRDIRLGTIIALLLVAMALWVFLEVADEVFDGETREFDESVLLAFRSSSEAGDPLGRVLAGCAAGSGWAFLCWGVADFLRNRGKIE